jgi:hypothetical protein
VARDAAELRRRRLGAGLLAFGASGLALLGIAIVLVLGPLASLGDAAAGFDRERARLVAALEPAQATLDHAATSAANAGTSLTDAADAARQASALTSQLADASDRLAGLGSLDILGTRPFSEAATSFGELASRSRSLSTSLGATADSLASNVTDSQAVAADLRSLSGQLQAIRGDLSTATPATGSFDLLRVLLVALLAWLAVPAVASLAVGWRMWRSG